jgi:hypothetical protein
MNIKAVKDALMSIKKKADRIVAAIPPKAANTTVAVDAKEVRADLAKMISSLENEVEEKAKKAASVVQNPSGTRDRKKAYKGVIKALAALKSGHTPIVRKYFEAKLQHFKWATYLKIMVALDKGDKKPALDYLEEKLSLLENGLKDLSADTSVTLPAYLQIQKQRLEKSSSKLNVALQGLGNNSTDAAKVELLKRLKAIEEQKKSVSERIDAATKEAK